MSGGPAAAPIRPAAGADPRQVETELRAWLERRGPASYDPYDGLACGPPWSLAGRWRPAARAWMQVVKRSPVNLRPLVGIPRHVMAKSLSDLASAALWRHRLGDGTALAEARRWLERLRAEARPGWSGACWAMPVRYVSRYIDAAPGTPNLFWTLNAAIAFLEAYELERRPEDLRTARSAMDFVQRDLGCNDAGDSGVWIPYFAGQEVVVYNVTVLAGAVLQRVALHTGEAALADLGRRAVRFVVRHQNADGSWWYSPGSLGRWVDGFHTGYVLEALLQALGVARRAGRADPEVEPALRRGVAFYLANLFTPAGVPRYAVDRAYPIEVQNCAQAVQTLARLCWLEPELLSRAEQVAAAVIAALYRREPGSPPCGSFRMSRGRWFSDATPMVRWGQAPMLLALVALRAAQRGLPPSWDGPAPGGDSRSEGAAGS